MRGHSLKTITPDMAHVRQDRFFAGKHRQAGMAGGAFAFAVRGIHTRSGIGSVRCHIIPHPKLCQIYKARLLGVAVVVGGGVVAAVAAGVGWVGTVPC